MSVEEIKEKIQHFVDRMNSTGMDVVEPQEMFTLRREVVILSNKSSQISNLKNATKIQAKYRYIIQNRKGVMKRSRI